MYRNPYQGSTAHYRLRNIIRIALKVFAGAEWRPRVASAQLVGLNTRGPRARAKYSHMYRSKTSNKILIGLFRKPLISNQWIVQFANNRVLCENMTFDIVFLAILWSVCELAGPCKLCVLKADITGYCRLYFFDFVSTTFILPLTNPN